MSVWLLIVGGIAGLVGSVVGAYTSLRMIRPQQAKVIAETESTKRSDDQALLDRYKSYVEHQDEQLHYCHQRISSMEIKEAEREVLMDDLERREKECEARNRTLERRVEHLEDVIDRAGLNGD